MVPKWCPRGPLDPQNEVPGDPGEVPGDARDPPETHPGQPGAALGSPGSPLGGHGVAQTAKVVILLKLSLILRVSGLGSAAEAGYRVRGRRRRGQPLLKAFMAVNPSYFMFAFFTTSRQHPTGARPDLRRLRRQPAAHREHYRALLSLSSLLSLLWLFSLLLSLSSLL